MQKTGATLGAVNQLKIVRQTDDGMLLDGGALGEILIPNRDVSKTWAVNDTIEVFLMLDSEDQLIATRLRPYAMVGEFAALRVAAVTRVGAFLEWGLPKDLFVPFREQKIEMQEGRTYVVYIYLDETSNRIAASAKLDKFLNRSPARYNPAEKVQLLICDKTDLGFKAIINGQHWGILFYSEVFQPLERGQKIEGFIKQIRPDGKIDLCLRKPGFEKVKDITEVILDTLKSQGGFIPITDKHPPEEIYRLFGVSKKSYKMAVGMLYKKRLITFEENGTRLL